MRPDTTDGASPAAGALLDPLRPRIDRVLLDFLAERRAETVEMAPDAAPLVDEIVRLLRAGGKRIRPTLCYWGYRAAGRPDAEEILRPAAALELLHTFALIHDDVMDEAEARRGVQASSGFLAREGAPDPAGAERFGRAAAVLVGDLCAALADALLLEAAFSPDLLASAFRRFNRMRMEMAAGQFLDVGAGTRTDEASVRRVSSLKTGSYTIEGPLHVGAILGAGSIELLAVLSRYGAPLGEAFQIRDDLEAVVGEERARSGAGRAAEVGGANMVVAIAARLATPAEREIILNPAARNPGDLLALVASTGAAFRAAELRDELVAQAREALDPSMIPEDAMRALERVADLIGSPEL
ncbi:MAG: polyprenyl synthetase family protein [Actinomycetota bacterium]|nr:polyprenyl synthetase family protein [Actinomycetota bacterium]